MKGDYRNGICNKCGEETIYGNDGNEIGLCDKCFDNLGYQQIGYTGEDCVSCGRNRVIKFKNGKKLCEKCNIDQKTNDYDPIWMETGGF